MKWLNQSEQANFWQDWSVFLQGGDGIRVRDCLARSGLPDRDWTDQNFDPATEFNQRWALLVAALPQLQQFFTRRQLATTWIEPLWQVWLPLARQLQRWREADRPLIVGFLGGQGSGKTTLTALLGLLLAQSGARSLSWSLDDLYLPYADRLALHKRDPRFVWRGPPGTHDVALGLSVLRALQSGAAAVSVPQFDKSLQGGAGDRSGFKSVAPVDFVLFEGWFVGAHPVAPFVFDDVPETVLTPAARQFARDMNMNLHAYLPLWAMLDRLVILHLPDYRWSKQWRQQAEHQMIAAGKPGMSDGAIDQFVDYFWQALHPEIFITPLTTSAGWTDLVLEIGVDHWPDRVHRPM
jgi:D-glycerate 3-kinase